jgi:hypothetical protein
MNKGRVGEERGGKETDGCPLTESLIGEAVEVQVLGSLKPTIEVCITWSIHTRFSNPVLSH